MSVLIAMGSNQPGPWGTPADSFKRCVDELTHLGLHIKACSPVYETVPMGRKRQPEFLNGVINVETHRPAGSLLRLLKQVERSAGRRSRGSLWGPRPLDLDILSYKNILLNWCAGPYFVNFIPLEWQAGRSNCNQLVLPHRFLHLRPFVLKPLMDIAPKWRHPVFNATAEQLWKRCQQHRSGTILRVTSLT